MSQVPLMSLLFLAIMVVGKMVAGNLRLLLVIGSLLPLLIVPLVSLLLLGDTMLPMSLMLVLNRSVIQLVNHCLLVISDRSLAQMVKSLSLASAPAVGAFLSNPTI